MAISKHERAYNVIRARILDGTYGPGFRLVLDALAREFGVSPVPVREAIRRLEAEGWVKFERHVGAQVAPLNEKELRQTFEVLALLEGSATALAAPCMRPKDLARARELNEQMRQLLTAVDPPLLTQLNREFHFVFYGRCPNDYLNGLVRQAWDRLDAMRRSMFVFVPRRAEASVDEHEHLVELVESGADPAEIELAAREHKLRTVNAYIAQRAERPAAAGLARSL